MKIKENELVNGETQFQTKAEFLAVKYMHITLPKVTYYILASFRFKSLNLSIEAYI